MNRRQLVFRTAFVIGLLSLLALACLLAYLNQPFVLEREDVLSLTVQDLRNDRGDTTSIQVSGHAVHSSYAVERMTTKIKGDTIIMKVFLVRVHGDLTGSFSYRQEVPETIAKVRFGNREELIWRRNVLVKLENP